MSRKKIKPKSKSKKLTSLERQLSNMILEGKSIEDIIKELDITLPVAVKTLGQLYQKLEQLRGKI